MEVVCKRLTGGSQGRAPGIPIWGWEGKEMKYSQADGEGEPSCGASEGLSQPHREFSRWEDPSELWTGARGQGLYARHQ